MNIEMHLRKKKCFEITLPGINELIANRNSMVSSVSAEPCNIETVRHASNIEVT